MKVKVKSLNGARLFATPWTVACTKLLCPWDFPGKSTGVGCHFFLQGIFQTQGLNPGLPNCRQLLHRLSHQRNPNEDVSEMGPEAISIAQVRGEEGCKALGMFLERGMGAWDWAEVNQ